MYVLVRERSGHGRNDEPVEHESPPRVASRGTRGEPHARERQRERRREDERRAVHARYVVLVRVSLHGERPGAHVRRVVFKKLRRVVRVAAHVCDVGYEFETLCERAGVSKVEDNERRERKRVSCPSLQHEAQARARRREEQKPEREQGAEKSSYRIGVGQKRERESDGERVRERPRLAPRRAP